MRSRGLILAICLTALAAAPAQAADYVAMGDSYSSGTGTRDYYAGQEDCQRSPSAYGPLIDPQIPGTFAFVACGGARTGNITNSGQHGEPAQATALSTATEYVTISIGGNDAGFSDVLVQCGLPFTNCNDDIDAAQAYIQNSLPGALNAVLDRIRQRSPHARVGLVGYPRIFPADGNDCSAATFFSSAEITRLNQTADMLAEVERARARAKGVTFIDPRQPFLGHAWCEDEWINGLASPTTESYHPNKRGHAEGYQGITRAAMLAAPDPDVRRGANGRVAFAGVHDGDSDIYVVNSSGAFAVPVTSNGSSDIDPAFSPDGTQIAYASDSDGDNEIYVMSAAGGPATKLTSNTADDRDPTWSPDGEFIAFRSNRDGDNEIFRMTAAGGAVAQLTANTASDFAPDWSPDGAEIAFQRFTSGTATGQGNEVFKMNADGQGQVNLTGTAASVSDGDPAYSPSGEFIVFRSDRAGNDEIHRMGPTGGSVTRLTTNAASDSQPVFSPDGAQIAFRSNRDGGDNEIYVMTASGTAQTRLTTMAGSDSSPTWQADAATPETTITSGPSGPTNLSTPTFEFASSEPGSTFECRIDTAPFAACPTPYTTPALSDGPHTIAVRATDPSGNTDPSPASRAFAVDTSIPQTNIDKGPSGRTNDSTPTFEFSSDTAVTFTCGIDTETLLPCSSPYTVPVPLPDGPHTFRVRGFNLAGSSSTSSVDFTVDTAEPETTIEQGPANPTMETAAQIAFTSSEAGSTFQCRLDPTADTAWSDCASPFSASGLGSGSHRFEVRAVDPAENTDPSPAVHEFVVDVTPPESAITGGPSGLTDDPTPTFAFGSEDGATLECRLDSAEEADWKTCTSEHTTAALDDGEHTFEVRARDRAGNVEPQPDARTFTVDTKVPETTITNGPGALTTDTTPSFSFESDDPDPTFECAIDSTAPAAFGVCEETFDAPPQGDGKHVFYVRAKDALHTDATPASYEFEVDSTAPETSIDSGPPPATQEFTAVTFTFSSSEQASTFQCSVDSGPYFACESPLTLDRLGQGGHSLQVRATDPAGNADPTAAAWLFTLQPHGAPRPPACARVQRGTALRDLLVGNSAGDRLLGLGGRDSLRGRGANDCLLGGEGEDRLNGGYGLDKLFGGPQNDRIWARDGARDRVACGWGRRDVALVDPIDAVRGCERVRRA